MHVGMQRNSIYICNDNAWLILLCMQVVRKSAYIQLCMNEKKKNNQVS